MKKILILISVTVTLAFLASSCATSSQTCAAYGNIQKYKKEVKY